ncbi:hypothetical protein N566_06545, partial [Streptomycetaceae bacterium MP113-05]
MTSNSETARRLVLERVRSGRLDPAAAAALLIRAGASADAAVTNGEVVTYTPVWEPAPQRRIQAGITADEALLVAVGTEGASTCACCGVPVVRLGQGPAGRTGSWAAHLEQLRGQGAGPRGLIFELPAECTSREAVEWALPLLSAVVSDRAGGPLSVVFLVANRGGAELRAALGAFAQVAGAEDRRLRAVSVQVEQSPDGAPDPHEVALAELSATHPGLAEVRHGAAGREVRTLRPCHPRSGGPGSASPFRDGGRYLITGGGKGVGLRIAALLAGDRQARLVLTGRSAPDARQSKEIRRLENGGARVLYTRGDVTRYEDVVEAVAVAEREFGGLDGVLHCAGLNEDAYLVNKGVESARRVLSVKLDGAAHLDRATGGMPLDFFALFSSTSAYFGAAGQSDYAAANRALGVFAAARADRVAAGSRCGTSVSVAWPLWAEGGMEISAENRSVLEEMQGMRPMPTKVGMRALSDSVTGGNAETMVVYGDAPRIDAWVGRCCTEVHPGGERAAPGGPPPGAGEPDGGLAARAETYLLDLVAATAKLPPGQLRGDQEFSTLGVDSILIKKLTAALEDRLGKLPVTLFFEYRTVQELAGFLAEQYPDALCAALGRGDGRDGPQAPAPAPEKTGRALPVAAVLPAPAAEPRDDVLEGGLPYDQAVAVVGLGGRYPGGADLQQFWQSLASGADLIREIPGDRWDNSRHLGAERGTPGAITGRWGGFLDDVSRFDPLFFAISPGEAAKLDPNERIFLEVAWSALEHAGYSRRKLHQTTRTEDGTHSVGVFVGVTGSQYGLVGAEQWGRGNKVFAHSMDYSIANRLSHFLDAHGPSMVLDTACSGSLTALHLACRSLLSGETRTAFAGGVNVNIHPIKYATLTDMRLLSSDGRCRAFGADGDGFVPGEGAGALVLKRLCDAIADGDRIHAVVRGTAVNHGGRSNGYTVPTPRAQGAVVTDALRAARVDARTVSYVEAHGTGTALGDPVEVEGLTRAFARQTRDTGFCSIGSVKSNLGHLEAAAGVCGITKVVLQFAHRTLVPTLHSDPVNPNLKLESTPFSPQQTTQPWPGRDGTPRRAAVSSFGAGGANGHVVLEEWCAPTTTAEDGRPYVVGLSARTPGQLQQSAERLATDLATDPSRCLREIAFTLLTGREEWEHRLAVVTTSRAGLLDALRAHLNGSPAAPVCTGRADRSDHGQEAPAALRAGRWEELARLWVAGARVAWHDAFADGPRPQPVPLPSYPFGGKRYWVDIVDEAAVARHQPEGHETQLLRRTDAVVADHLVQGQAVIAGVVQLGLARAAAPFPAQESAVVFEDVRWRVPLQVEDDALQVDVSFDGSAYEVRNRQTGTVHSTGTLTAGGAEVLGDVDIDAVRGRCTRRTEAAEVYGRALDAGLQYGPLFRGLVALHRGEGEALAELSEPDLDVPRWALEAAMTDSALHAVQGVLPEGQTQPALPASVSRITVKGPARQARYAHAELVALDGARGMARVDVSLADAEGTLLVRFEGLRVVRPADSEGGTRREEGVPLYRSVWRPAPLEPAVAADDRDTPVLVLTPRGDHGLGAVLAAHHRAAGSTVRHALLDDVPISAEGFEGLLEQTGWPGTVWFLGGVEERLYAADDLEQLDLAVTRGPVALFHLLQALAARRSEREVRLRVVTSGVQQTDEGTTARNPFAGGVPGLVASASRELRSLSFSCTDVAREDLLWCARRDDWGALIGQLAAEPASRPAHAVALAGGIRHARSLERIEVPDVARELPLREGGRYLITGGGGGLGRVVGEYLARVWDAQVLLVGRRPKQDVPQKVRSLLDAQPDKVAYVSADVTDEAGLRAAVSWMHGEWGGVDGVVHSAFVLNDRTLARMDEQTLRSSFGPKAYGTVMLQRVLADQPLDFFALFSSAISHNGNAGQANYAAASTLQDAYGRFLAALLQRPVKVFNWGLWGESGSVATDDYRSQVTARLGVEPISDAAGLEAFGRVLSGPAVQVAPVRLTGAGREPAARVLTGAAQPSTASRVAEAAARKATAEGPGLVDAGFFDDLEPYARQLLRDAFLGHGSWPAPGSTVSRGKLGKQVGVLPSQERLWAAVIYALERGRHLEVGRDGMLTVPAGEPELPDPAATAALRDRLIDAHPHAAGLADLLRECTEALPDILCGRRNGLSVLFPGGSDHKLTPLYHDDPRSEHFNSVCAAAG